MSCHHKLNWNICSEGGHDTSGIALKAAWNDLNERKQKLRLSGSKIIDPRPTPPGWISSCMDELYLFMMDRYNIKL